MVSRKKIWLYDIVIVIILTIVGIILCKQEVFTPSQLFTSLIGVTIVVSLLSMLLFFKTKIISFIKEEWKYRLSLIFKIISVLHRNYKDRMIETIFAYFVHYYEMNVSEISQDREFPKDEFPEGSYELIKVYVYITQLRKRNRKLVSKVDFSKSHPMLFNMSFKHLKFKINKNYELQIVGSNDEETMTFIQFTSFLTKIENAIYDTDTQIANWLIKNRNHFGF